MARVKPQSKLAGNNLIKSSAQPKSAIKTTARKTVGGKTGGPMTPSGKMFVSRVKKPTLDLTKYGGNLPWTGDWKLDEFLTLWEEIMLQREFEVAFQEKATKGDVFWGIMSTNMMFKGYDRSDHACRLWWGRNGRRISKFEECVKPRGREAGVSSSIQKKKERKKVARKVIEEVVEDEGSAESEEE